MSAVLIAAGQGHLSVEKVHELVENPTETGAVNKTSIYNVPPYALYLTNVEYQDKGKYHGLQ
jgi:tRNA U38,U39,U40 pseudouridine synthase TruA